MLSDAALNQIFRTARTHNLWTAEPVSDATLHAVYELMRWGPTSANCCPARILFLRSAAGKQRLAPALSQGNLAKTMAAPVTAVVAYDLDFADKVPRLFPHKPEAKLWFADATVASVTAMRNGSLQGAYFIIAARALGLDTGPMSGFDNAKVDAEFFPGGRIKSNFLCNLGYGDPAGVFARSPRLDFDEACTIL
jgi:3-hydroxypropanoate dehydrogenase